MFRSHFLCTFIVTHFPTCYESHIILLFVINNQLSQKKWRGKLFWLVCILAWSVSSAAHISILEHFSCTKRNSCNISWSEDLLAIIPSANIFISYLFLEFWKWCAFDWRIFFSSFLLFFIVFWTGKFQIRNVYSFLHFILCSQGTFLFCSFWRISLHFPGT